MVSKLSLTIVGMQCSGPAEPALLEAPIQIVGLLQRLGLVMTMALMAGPFLS